MRVSILYTYERAHPDEPPFAQQPEAVKTPATPTTPETRADRDRRIADWSESLAPADRERAIAASRTGFVSPTLPDGSPTHPEGMPTAWAIRAAWERAHPDETPYDELPRD